jgi:hypothetical protein
MSIRWRPSPHPVPLSGLRRPPSLTHLMPLALALLGAPAWSQSDPALPALQAAQSAIPARAAPLLNLPETGNASPQATPQDLQAARDIWRQANQRVAEFPRGHIDLLRWEANTPPANTPPSDSTGAAGPLSLREALRQSLQHRPELFTRTGMNALVRAKVQVAYARHVRELHRAWIDAVATRQAARHAGEVLHAARTGSELGRRMVQAGNWSNARLMSEQLIEADAWQAAADAQATALAARERLAGFMGAWDAASVAALEQRLPDALPALPAKVEPGPGWTEADIETAALRTHAPLALALQTTQREVAALSPGRWQAWATATDAALQAMPEASEHQPAKPPHLDDPSLLGDHGLEKAVQAHARLLAMAAERRSMARQAWAQVRLRHASAQHAQDVVSELQAAREQETLLRYNGMLQSSWELLASARERIQSLDAALQARRGYWRAQADWQALLSGADYTGPDATLSTGTATSAAAAH